MNKIDFTTLPAGFPLTADAILGQLQDNINEVLTVLGKMMQLPPAGFAVVLSGCVVTGSSMTDGWILLNVAGTYEIFFFQGGTVQSTYIIDEDTVTKNNQDGTPIPRIYTRKVVFGTGVGSFLFQDLYPFGTISQAFEVIADVAKASGSSANWVLVSGFDAVSAGAGGITGGVALYNGKVLIVPAYGSAVSSGSPVYLQSDGTWTAGTPSGVVVTFAPYSDLHLRCFYRKRLHPVGSLLPMKAGVTELTTFFPGTGLGIGEWVGWSIANGNNSTLNLSSEIASVSWIQRMS